MAATYSSVSRSIAFLSDASKRTIVVSGCRRGVESAGVGGAGVATSEGMARGIRGETGVSTGVAGGESGVAESRCEGVEVEENNCRSVSSELVLLLRRTRSLSIMS